MLRICKICKTVQSKNSSNRCNQFNCKGTLAKAWKCDTCDTVQESALFNNCKEPKCKGKLQKLKDQINLGMAPPREVMPSSHVFFPTAAEMKKLSVEDEESEGSMDFRQKLQKFEKQKFNFQPPPSYTKSKEKEPIIEIEPPKVLKSEIPIRKVSKHNVTQDVAIAKSLMESTELRKIVIINMLEEYGPSEGAKQALEWTKHLPGVKEMTLTMNVIPQGAKAWDLMGAKCFKAGFAACQQCVAIMFHKLLQNPNFSSCIQLVHVKGHHFLVFGEMNNHTWILNKTYIVDLWLQNLHRPPAKFASDLGRETEGWSTCVTRLDDPGQTFYIDLFPTWVIDLTYDPLG